MASKVCVVVRSAMTDTDQPIPVEETAELLCAQHELRQTKEAVVALRNKLEEL